MSEDEPRVPTTTATTTTTTTSSSSTHTSSSFSSYSRFSSSSSSQHVPEGIKNFLISFYAAFEEKNMSQIYSHYENDWNKLVDKTKNNELPHPERISQFIQDETFLCLYGELYYRELHAKLQVPLTIEQRIESWQNYSKLFEIFLEQKKKYFLFELPAQWIWDLLNEFLYQYLEFCQFKSRIITSNDRTSTEATKMNDHPQVWNTVSVIKYYLRFVDKSDIKRTLEIEKSGGVVDPAHYFASSTFYQYLGYFSLILLCKFHCVTGDYYMALKIIDSIELHKKKIRTAKVTSAHITLYYYAGFSYMMARRYHDAIKTFASVLMYISRMKSYQARQSVNQKKNDKMFALLAILLHYCPKRIDETIINTLRQEHANKLLSATGREYEETEQSFLYGCPRFVSPSVQVDEFETPTNPPLFLQKKNFMREMGQQVPLPLVRSYLKLYTTIDLDKLATLMEKKHDLDTLRSYLLRFVYKNYQLQWSNGLKPIEGNWISSTSLDFFIDGDMVHVVDNTETRRFAEIFLRNCNKLDEIIHELESTTK